MAEKRMFSKKIIDTDWFMDMPASTQNLYFHLSMRADDDGFVSSPKRIIKLIGASEDDYKVLIAKKFVIPFESGVCVITDWRINNYLRNDRHSETIYQEEKKCLSIDENGKYIFGIPNVNQLPTERYTQNSIEKNSIDKDNKKEINKEKVELVSTLNSYKDNFSEECFNAIRDWLKYKKEKKQSYKLTGLKTLLNKLKEWKENNGDSYVIDAIQNSICNNYSGIFPKKDNQVDTPKKYGDGSAYDYIE